MMIRSSLSIVSYVAAAARRGLVLPTRPPRRARSGVFKFFTSWGGEGGRGRSSAQPVFSRAGGHFPSPLLRGASLRDADAVGARIPAGATRATKATGREAVAVTETSVAALLADGARRRGRRARRRAADRPELLPIQSSAVARALEAHDRLAILELVVLHCHAEILRLERMGQRLEAQCSGLTVVPATGWSI